MNSIQSLLTHKPYLSSQEQKTSLLQPLVVDMAKWHYGHSSVYKKIAVSQGFNPKKTQTIDSVPYVPVVLFKQADLRSVDRKAIVKTLFSSSTSGTPSKVQLDKETARYQMVALSNIMKDYLGENKRTFIIFDSPSTVRSNKGILSSRGTAIRGFLSFSKRAYFVLNDDLSLNEKELRRAIKSLEKDEIVCFFGFTWLIYSLIESEGLKHSKFFNKAQFDGSLCLHIGGWKKLQDKAVSKKDFNLLVSKTLSVSKSDVIDFYGMTEQLGTVYPDCSEGYKHIPLYSELIIRDYNTLAPLPVGNTGFINLISPIPHSYPGVSVLSDDIGRIIGIDDCKCGRKGKYFVFEKRSETAELKGCGDVLQLDT